MFCVLVLLDFEKIAPGMGFQHNFSAPGVGVSHFFCARRVGNSPFQKIPQGFCLGGWSGLELTDTLFINPKCAF